MQVINGEARAHLECDQHVKIVCDIITDILNRRIDIHMKKTTSRKVATSK